MTPLPSPGEPVLPALPKTFRPRRALWMLGGLAVAIAVSMTVLAVVLPAPGRTTPGWTAIDRLGVIAVALLILGGLALLARPRVRAEPDGLVVINVARAHRLSWAQIVAVRMSRNDAWMVLDLDDGSTLNAMGVQSADGDRGRATAVMIARIVAAKSIPARDD